MIFKRSQVSEFANSAGGVFTVLFTIVIAVGMVRILSLAAGGRIDNAAVLQMVLYNALTNLPPLLAVSLFAAVLMTLMRWWQDNEWWFGFPRADGRSSPGSAPFCASRFRSWRSSRFCRSSFRPGRGLRRK